jgi:hypothetical protein
MLRHHILGTTGLQQMRVRLRPLLVNFDVVHRTALERLVEQIEHWVAMLDMATANAIVRLMAERWSAGAGCIVALIAWDPGGDRKHG